MVSAKKGWNIDGLTLEELRVMNEQCLIPVYESGKPGTPEFKGRQYPIAPLRADEPGIKFRGIDGHIYHDFIAGIATNALGYNHPWFEWALQELKEHGTPHHSNFYTIWQQSILAYGLRGLLIEEGMNDPKMFFCNSGAEATNGALKAATLNNKRPDYVAMKGSFHGRYGDALGATVQPGKREKWEGLLRKPAAEMDFNAADQVDKLVTDKIGSIIVEPVQGEGGVVPAKRHFLHALRERCDETGTLLIADEVQTYARTGALTAMSGYGVAADIVCGAKQFALGYPAGFIAFGKNAHLFQKGDHASTFGGGPGAMTFAYAFLRAIEEERLFENSIVMGTLLQDRLAEKLGDLIEKGRVKEIRGRGLLIGVEVDGEKYRDEIIRRCYSGAPRVVFGPAGALGRNVVRLAPPLIISKEDANMAVTKLAEAAHAAARVS